jgi:hypothetical protein
MESMMIMPTNPEEQSIVFYTTPTGNVNVQVLFNNETLWLPQKRMAELFGVDRSVITKHLKNIFESGELDPQATCAIIAQVQFESDFDKMVKRLPKKHP